MVEVGYRATLRHPTARRLWLATAVSAIGDYVGMGALLLMAYERSGGRAVAPAALFAIQALPAMLTGLFAGSWLDDVSRRTSLVTLQLLGAAAVALPVAVGGLVPVYVAAATLGALRAAHVSVRSGAIAEGVPVRFRGPLLALIGTTDQASQVLGYATGAVVTVTVGASIALIADAVTFVLGAIVLSALLLNPPLPRERRPAPTAGFREIWRNPILRLLAPLVWATATVAAIPESLAAEVTRDDPDWTPWVIAAGPLGQAITMAVLGRVRHVVRPPVQMLHIVWLSLALGLAALGRSPLWYAVGNRLVGSGVAWLLGPQTTFVRIAPPERMAQITGTMIATIIALEGVGTLVFGFIADHTSVSTTYRVAGFLVLATGLLGWFRMERTPGAEQLGATATPPGVALPVVTPPAG